MHRLIPALALLCLLAACGGGSRQTAPQQRAADQALDDHSRRVAELERRLDELGQRLTPQGRWAYAGGPVLEVDAQGRTISLLQRLHDLKQELASARTMLDGRLAELEAGRRHQAEAELRIKAQERDLTLLANEKAYKEYAQGELAVRAKEIAALKEQVQASELKRLEVERAYYGFASELLVLRPVQAQEIQALQRTLRAALEGVALPGPDAGPAATPTAAKPSGHG